MIVIAMAIRAIVVIIVSITLIIASRLGILFNRLSLLIAPSKEVEILAINCDINYKLY